LLKSISSKNTKPGSLIRKGDHPPIQPKEGTKKKSRLGPQVGTTPKARLSAEDFSGIVVLRNSSRQVEEKLKKKRNNLYLPRREGLAWNHLDAL